jgi:hypothetical protein
MLPSHDEINALRDRLIQQEDAAYALLAELSPPGSGTTKRARPAQHAAMDDESRNADSDNARTDVDSANQFPLLMSTPDSRSFDSGLHDSNDRVDDHANVVSDSVARHDTLPNETELPRAWESRYRNLELKAAQEFAIEPLRAAPLDSSSTTRRRSFDGINHAQPDIDALVERLLHRMRSEQATAQFRIRANDIE